MKGYLPPIFLVLSIFMHSPPEFIRGLKLYFQLMDCGLRYFNRDISTIFIIDGVKIARNNVDIGTKFKWRIVAWTGKEV